MSRYDGLIIPRSYSEYINKTDAATLLQALQLTGVMDATPTADSKHPVKSGGVFTGLRQRPIIKVAENTDIEQVFTDVGLSYNYLKIAIRSLINNIESYNTGFVTIASGGPIFGFSLWKYNDAYFEAVVKSYMLERAAFIQIRGYNGTYQMTAISQAGTV